MKSKYAGIAIFLVIVLVASGYYMYSSRTKTIELDGYLGGEKIGLFEDEEVQKILQKKYHIQFDYSRAGSFDMVTADATGRDYLFPSSQTALELYQSTYGKPKSDEIIFNTPIVVYTHKNVADALLAQGAVSETDGVYSLDMKKLTDMMLVGTQWSEIGLSELYGSILVDTTDPVKSNSGNMFAALLACVLNDGQTVTQADVSDILPDLQNIFSRIGYMETSSSNLFDQFIRLGVGAEPMIAGYESQILEYANEEPEAYAKVKDDIVILYPTPTVWSTHIYIALTDEGKQGAEALLDEDIQKLAWEKHGFRTGNYEIADDTEEIAVPGIAKQPTTVINMPEYAAMKKIMEGLTF